MMKNFILLALFMCLQAASWATPPTVTGSNISFNSIDGSRFSSSFTPGNGLNRIVVVKEGSPVTGLPVNGVQYNANEKFGTAGTEFTQPGEYVIARSSWPSFTVSGLQPGTTYYVAIFEYNGSNATTEYLALPLTGSQATVSAPTIQASNVSLTSTSGNTMNLSWVKGNGSGRMIIARKGSAVSEIPADLFFYSTGDGFGSGTKLGADNYVVYKGAASTATIKNLEPNTTYHFAVFEFNGNNNPVFLNPAVQFSATTHAGPTVAPSSAGFNYVEGNSFTINVTAGNGTRRLFIAKKGSAVTAVPVNGMTYTTSAVFGTAASEIVPGEFVVAATGGTGVSISNLEPNTTYHFRVFEYDIDANGNTYYLTSSFATKSGSTSTPPTLAASNLFLSSIAGTSGTLKFTPGNGTYRMVIMKEGSPVDATPADLVRYSANSSFGSGQEITPGNFCVISGMNGAQFSVNNLLPGVTYHAALYEYNGSYYPVYSAAAATCSFTMPAEPTVIANTPRTSSIEGNGFRLSWNNGNGARRLVIARKAAAVTAKPSDQVIYTANATFGLGETLSAGEFVVYDGNASYMDLTSMEIGTTYHFAIYEYNLRPDGKPDYLTTSWLATTGTTTNAPSTQAVITSISNIQSAQATINFSGGNGAGRIFIMKAGSPVSVMPQDLIKYTYNTAFGTTASLISDGNYVVALKGDGWPFTITSLQPNTTYYISVFEYNGSTAPVYQRNSPSSHSFTTTDIPGATVPTAPATNAGSEKTDGNKFTFKWSNGNGEKRIVVMREGTAPGFAPQAGVNYAANSAFGSGTDLGNGQYVVYNGNGNSVDLTNLLPSTDYHFAVYEYNGSTSLIRYLVSSALTANVSTAAAPTVAVSEVERNTTSNQLTLTWMNGNGTGRIVVLKEGSAVSAVPADLAAYPANAVFKSGSQIAAGEYVVYAGTGNSVTITSLSRNTYHFRIFEYNGTAAPVYNTANAVAGEATITSTLPVKLLYFTAKEKNEGVLLNWATSEEINTASFVVEKSSTGDHYQPIATIAAAGNSSQTITYQYTDENLANGTYFYRLKQTDHDGRFTYSPVREVEIKSAKEIIKIYPNPASNGFKLLLPVGMAQAGLSIYNATGVLVKQQKVLNNQYIPVSDLPVGVYHITVQVTDKLLSTTLLIQ